MSKKLSKKKKISRNKKLSNLLIRWVSIRKAGHLHQMFGEGRGKAAYSRKLGLEWRKVCEEIDNWIDKNLVFESDTVDVL